MKPTEMRLGQIVQQKLYCGKLSCPMVVVGLHYSIYDTSDADVYLDFEDNEGDVWEAKASECVPVKL